MGLGWGHLPGDGVGGGGPLLSMGSTSSRGPSAPASRRGPDTIGDLIDTVDKQRAKETLAAAPMVVHEPNPELIVPARPAATVAPPGGIDPSVARIPKTGPKLAHARMGVDRFDSILLVQALTPE